MNIVSVYTANTFPWILCSYSNQEWFNAFSLQVQSQFLLQVILFYQLYYIKVLFLHIEYAMPRERKKTRLNLRELVLVTKILKS